MRFIFFLDVSFFFFFFNCKQHRFHIKLRLKHNHTLTYTHINELLFTQTWYCNFFLKQINPMRFTWKWTLLSAKRKSFLESYFLETCDSIVSKFKHRFNSPFIVQNHSAPRSLFGQSFFDIA